MTGSVDISEGLIAMSRDLPSLGMLPDDGNRLSWGDIVARAPVFSARHDVEVLFDNLFPAR
jgi:hypothetical protein